MRKEVVFAIFFGTLFGLVVAFGVWRLNSSLSNNNQSNKTESTPTPSQAPETLGLTIAKPNELSVIRESTIKIEGVTRGNSWVVVSGEEEDSIARAEENGAFSIDSDLVGGLNQIIITSFEESGTKSQKTILLVHSSQFPTLDNNQEDSTQTAVDQKIKEAQNPPVAYIGTITDISGDTLNLRNAEEEIKQVASQADTSFANEITKKETKFKDLAIGDFVIAMGYRNGNHVLKAKRIIVTGAPRSPLREIHLGEVKEIKNRVLTLVKPDGEIALSFPKSWKGPDIDEIDKGVKVIVVTDSEGKNSIRTIQIITK